MRITTTAAAIRLGVSTARIRELVKLGKLTGSKEPFGPGTRYMIDVASIAKRERAKSAGKLPKGGAGMHKPKEK